MKATQVGKFKPDTDREVCVICGGIHQPMFRDCHGQAICSKECQNIYLNLGGSERDELH